jgi:NADH dehydrogenase
MPSWERKFRVFWGWWNNFWLGRDIVSLSAVQQPRAQFEAFAARPKVVTDAAPQQKPAAAEPKKAEPKKVEPKAKAALESKAPEKAETKSAGSAAAKVVAAEPVAAK